MYITLRGMGFKTLNDENIKSYAIGPGHLIAKIPDDRNLRYENNSNDYLNDPEFLKQLSEDNTGYLQTLIMRNNINRPEDFINDLTKAEYDSGFEDVRACLLASGRFDIYKSYASLPEDPKQKLEFFKQYAIDFINFKKEEEIKKGVGFKSNIYQCDERSRSNLAATVFNYSLDKELTPSTIDWISKDNKQINLSFEDLVKLNKEINSFIKNITFRSRDKKDKILKANTPEEIEALLEIK